MSNKLPNLVTLLLSLSLPSSLFINIFSTFLKLITPLSLSFVSLTDKTLSADLLRGRRTKVIKTDLPVVVFIYLNGQISASFSSFSKLCYKQKIWNKQQQNLLKVAQILDTSVITYKVVFFKIAQKSHKIFRLLFKEHLQLRSENLPHSDHTGCMELGSRISGMRSDSFTNKAQSHTKNP